MTANSRIVNIDIARGLGIAAVVLGHNWIVLHDKGALFRVIYSFHLPLFFFLSGVFLNGNVEWRGFLRSKAESLIKPYFVVIFLALLLKYSLLSLKGSGGEGGEFIDIVKIIYGTASIIPWAPLWFLPHLFLVSIFSLWIIKATEGESSYYLWACSVSMLLAGIFFLKQFADWSPGIFGFSSMGNVGLPWSIDLIFVSSPFVIFGYLLRDKIFYFDFNLSVFLFAVLVFFGLHFLFADTIDLNSRLYDGFLVATVNACSGIYIIICLASLLGRSAFVASNIARFGSGSLFILLFHGIVQNVSFSFLSRFSVNFFVAGFLSFVVALVLPVFLLDFVNKKPLLSLFLLGSKKIS